MLRFLLEIAAITTFGIWGWKQGTDWDRFLWVLLLPIIFMTVWGVFAVPGDPSRSGNAPIPVAGWLRLLIELCIFVFTTWALYDLGFLVSSMIFAGICLLHYSISYDRVIWLLNR